MLEARITFIHMHTQSSTKARLMLEAIVDAVCRKTPNPEIGYDEPTRTFEVRVNPKDQGRIIGIKGTVVWASSVALRYAGIAMDLDPFFISIPKQPESDRREPELFEPREEWDKTKLTRALDSILSSTFQGAKKWSIRDDGRDAATVSIPLPAEIQVSVGDPSFEKAISILVKAFGSAAGAKVSTRIEWQ